MTDRNTCRLFQLKKINLVYASILQINTWTKIENQPTSWYTAHFEWSLDIDITNEKVKRILFIQSKNLSD